MKMEQAGRPAGFGFVEFEDAETARSAIALFDGRLLHGRPMKGTPTMSCVFVLL
jgi:RNA recognition motif-containing protein